MADGEVEFEVGESESLVLSVVECAFEEVQQCWKIREPTI